MAKKTKSYSPNLGLIQGEALMRGTKAAAKDIGAQAFTMGFLGVYQASMKEKRDRESRMANYMADLGNIANISKLEDGYNKQAVTDFLRKGRNKAGRGPKNVDAATYAIATGFETIVGWLFLKNPNRLADLFDLLDRPIN